MVKPETSVITAISNLYTFLEKGIIQYRRAVLILISIIHTLLANYLAFVIRFESIISPAYLNMFLQALPLLVFIRIFLFIQSGFHKDLWRYSSINDMVKIIRSTVTGSAAFFMIHRVVLGNTSYPLSIYILDALIFIFLSGGSRLFIRVFREYVHSHNAGKNILIVGGGDAGENIIRDIQNDRISSYRAIGIIDEDSRKKGLTIRGVPILGPVSTIPRLIDKHNVEEIFITTPYSRSDNIREIYELSKPYGIAIKKLPGISDILEGNTAIATKLGQSLIEASLVTEEKVQQALLLQKKEGGRLGSKLVKLGYISQEMLISFLSRQFGISHMKPISLDDLLLREPVQADISTIRRFIENTCVLVTGAGGSIGSELCRQIIDYSPARLVLFDRYENSLYSIDLELKEICATMNGDYRSKVIPVIGDITEPSCLEHLFSHHKPDIVFHAAAHKHVPLMEYNPIESVKNNILGTKNLIDAASRHLAGSFVMISTDKAVNPSSIMGATKRVAEFLTISENARSGTKFTTVRFGNVLGSNGSVIPLFKEQLNKGGPLTVTHPDIKRYFMLTREAAQLVLLAASTGNGGEIFVLDMGEQIKICSLAENLIRLSGFIPEKEIRIAYTGLRPGEKLSEELFDKSERIIRTSYEKIRIAVPDFLPDIDIPELKNIVETYDIPRIVPAMQRIVPNYLNGKNGSLKKLAKK